MPYTGATGQNWLFFGNPHFTQDFLYQVELQDYLKRGVLSKLDVAFSRDQAEKIYVQHKLQAKGAEVWSWLEQGAHLYICGDGSKMAKDVHQALLQIAQQFGGLTEEAAADLVGVVRISLTRHRFNLLRGRVCSITTLSPTWQEFCSS